MKSNQTLPQGVNKPKTKLGQIKMDKLITTAEHLFTQKGFYNTSIADICKEAQTAVGTFYIYFDTKTDVYRFLMEKYKTEIRNLLTKSIANCTTRYEKEREGIKCFVKYAVSNPNVYDIIWGSLSIDRNMFVDYYESFAKSYIKSLDRDKNGVSSLDHTTIAYILMGISNFLGLRAMFEEMNDEKIDEMIDNSVMPALSKGFLVY